MIDKDGTRVREMCTKWINKGKWPKLEGIWMGIFQIIQKKKALKSINAWISSSATSKF
jgi:hypothetical protein